jgi:hypothetical protein
MDVGGLDVGLGEAEMGQELEGGIVQAAPPGPSRFE